MTSVNNISLKDGERPSTAEKPSDLQKANLLLLQNKVAIDGVLLAVDAALNSTSTATAAANFNSELGLKPATIVGLIEGFDASLVRTLYSEDGYELAKTILMIFSTKKIQALTDSDVTQM